ncbi:MAG: PorV/PorQ family protein [Elusimicrobiota bacterium]
MKNKRILFITGILLFLYYGLKAEDIGTTSGITLLQPVSARASATAQTSLTLLKDVSILNYNPSGLTSLKQPQFNFMYQRGLYKDKLASMIYGKKNMGFGIQYYDTGKLEMYNADGDPVIETGKKDIIITVGGGENLGELSGKSGLEKISIGGNIKFISSEVFGIGASAFAVDAGGYCRLMKDKLNKLNAGISVQNIGGKLKYLENEENLPVTARLEIGYCRMFSGDKLNIGFDMPYNINEEEIFMALGGEYTYKNMVTARTGVELNLSGTENDSAFNFGIGINLSRYSIDYSVGLTDALDMPQRIGLRIKY